MMREMKHITLSHKSTSYLKHKLELKMQSGWQQSSVIYESKDGVHCVDMEIETSPVIYTSISGILYPKNAKAQASAIDLYKANKIPEIRFIPSAVENLTLLLENNDARLKVHSNWRYRLYSESHLLTELFLNNGFLPDHLHRDFFVPFKGKDCVRSYDIEFSNSDDSLMNIVIDTRRDLDLSSQFMLYNPVPSGTGLTLVDMHLIDSLIKRNT